MLTAMSFCYFNQQQCDMVVVEVGLGGRRDPTNVIDPLLSVITSIGLDHLNVLGNTLEEIAHQKAGIIKPSRPVVVGWDSQPLAVFVKEAQLLNSPIYFTQGSAKGVDFEEYNNQLVRLAGSTLRNCYP